MYLIVDNSWNYIVSFGINYLYIRRFGTNGIGDFLYYIVFNKNISFKNLSFINYSCILNQYSFHIYFGLKILFNFILITPKIASEIILPLILDFPLRLSVKITGTSTI